MVEAHAKQPLDSFTRTISYVSQLATEDFAAVLLAVMLQTKCTTKDMSVKVIAVIHNLLESVDLDQTRQKRHFQS